MSLCFILVFEGEGWGVVVEYSRDDQSEFPPWSKTRCKVL